MTDEEDPPADAAECARQAEEMRAAAEQAFDPAIAAQYLALAAEWLRLAERGAGRRGSPTSAEEDA